MATPRRVPDEMRGEEEEGAISPGLDSQIHFLLLHPLPYKQNARLGTGKARGKQDKGGGEKERKRRERQRNGEGAKSPFVLQSEGRYLLQYKVQQRR